MYFFNIKRILSNIIQINLLKKDLYIYANIYYKILGKSLKMYFIRYINKKVLYWFLRYLIFRLFFIDCDLINSRKFTIIKLNAPLYYK